MPEGDLLGMEELATPTAPMREAIGGLAAVSAARLRLRLPADTQPVALDAVLAAAALGARRRPDRAVALLEAVPVPRRFADVVTLHGLAGPALETLSPAAPASRVFGADGARGPGSTEPLAPDTVALLTGRSPLTGLLGTPAPGGETTCEQVLDLLLERPDARQLATAALAAPAGTAAQSRWRGGLLDRYRHEEPQFVLDVYEFALLHHREEHLRLVAAARQALRTGGEGSGDAHAVAVWWQALAALDRSAEATLRRRRHLHRSYRAGVRLHALSRASRPQRRPNRPARPR